MTRCPLGPRAMISHGGFLVGDTVASVRRRARRACECRTRAVCEFCGRKHVRVALCEGCAAREALLFGQLLLRFARRTARRAA